MPHNGSRPTKLLLSSIDSGVTSPVKIMFPEGFDG